MNLLDLLFPKKCLECGCDGSYLCGNCVEKVLDGTFDENNFSIFKYKGVIRKAITSLKYKFATDIADELVSICIKRLKSNKFHSITLVPIPLHANREKWRGFNQSELIGEKMAKVMNWDYLADLLIRQKQTEPQVGLKGQVRKDNIIGIFNVDKNQIKNIKHPILIFDDVYTTGSTIMEAKKVLNKSGVKNIYSLTIAR